MIVPVIELYSYALISTVDKWQTLLILITQVYGIALLFVLRANTVFFLKGVLFINRLIAL